MVAREGDLAFSATFWCLTLIAAAACGGAPTTPASSEWESERRVEGDTTIVTTTSGSKWGGTARLEEELSIGVLEGEEPFMFGRVTAVWATDDRVYVVDSQVPAVRVYDADGNHLLDLGREGQGPGEYETPTGITVTDDGKILVVDESTRINIFAADGTPLETWGGTVGFRLFVPRPLVLGTDGTPYVFTLRMPQEGGALAEAQMGMQAVGRGGEIGELLVEPDLGLERDCLQYTRGGRADDYCAIPFAPSQVSAFAPSGAWIVGISDRYRFEIRHRNGTRTVADKYWTPVPVQPDEAAYHKERVTALIRERAQDPSWTWNGPEVPDRKPAYSAMLPDRSGRVWLTREGSGRRREDCDESFEEYAGEDLVSCWTSPTIWDAFDLEGDYLGALEAPEEIRGTYATFIRGEVFATTVVDELGTAKVKRYRIVLPPDA